MTKQITIGQLESLTWEIASVEHGDHQFEELDPDVVGIDDDGEYETEARFSSFVYGTCLLRSIEHPEITYTIDWLAQGGSESMALAYEFGIDVNEMAANVLDAPGYRIVDIDGDEIDEREAVRQVGNDIEESIEWEAVVRKGLPDLGTELLEDIDKDTDMTTIELQRDNGPDVRFQGEEIASASSHHYEGQRNIRWTELTLYRTRGGKLVCAEIGRTCWQGERTKYRVHVAETEAELVEALGYGWLAKELYDEAGIDHAQEIG